MTDGFLGGVSGYRETLPAFWSAAPLRNDGVVPTDAIVVVALGPRGRSRRAYRCAACGTTVVPPDEDAAND